MLARKIFKRIAERFESRSADFEQVTNAGYSFEEWCNWEAYLACAQVRGWNTQPRPQYSKLCTQGSKLFGDLLITRKPHRVVVEIGHAHDDTGNKWLRKLDGDRTKLSCEFQRGVTPLHIVILTSTATSDIHESSIWKPWLSKLGCWSIHTKLKHECGLGKSGQMIIRGWTGKFVS